MIRALVPVCLLLCLAACQGRPGSTGDDAGVAECAVDGDCPAGMVCEGCGTPQSARCVPGCRTSAQCPPALSCQGPVQCFTCPCAPGWCELDPCRDVDGDGYVPTARDPVSCPGKLPGDCDDARRDAHPGGVEQCSNGQDDDCDGLLDRQDTASCDTCGQGEAWCNTGLHCQEAAQCTRGCCRACPPVPTPLCGAGLCPRQGPRDPATGCRGASSCVACASCPAAAPVCGLDYVTHWNACLAAAAGVAVLHDGGCLDKEGQACVGDEWCGTVELFCGTQGGRCTQRGSCLNDADCLRAQELERCADGGFGPSVCEAHRCVTRCP